MIPQPKARWTDRAARRFSAYVPIVLALIVLGLLILAGFLSPAYAQTWRADVPLPPHWPTVHRHTQCPGLPDASGCVAPVNDPICGDPAGCVWLAGTNRYDRMHELGHIFDQQVLTDVDRQRFTRLLGLKGPWVHVTTKPGGGATESWGSPNEWFADAYAHCAMHIDGRVHNGVARLVIAYFQPSPRQYDRLCAAIRFVALS